ncbi:MAG: hypothetical protein ACKO7N_01915 [Candidatus Nitrosotenuis sp.]
MNLPDYDNIKILGIIDELGPTVSAIKKRTMLELPQIEQALEFFEKNGMIEKSLSRGFFGNSRVIFRTSQSGKDELAQYMQYRKEQWKELIEIASQKGRAELDESMRAKPGIVNLMVFFGIVDLSTLSRLNLRHLVSANTPCYICKKELDQRFMQKFTISEIQKCHFAIPAGMAISDHICADCFDHLGK